MYKYFLPLLFLVLMGCPGPDQPVQSMLPAATIHAFVDVDVASVDAEKPGNIERILTLIQPIKKKYVRPDRISPIDFTLHPLYYNSAERDLLFSIRIGEDDLKNIGGAGRDRIVSKFNPVVAYKKFYKEHLSGESQGQMTNRKIWPSIYHFADLVRHSTTDIITIIYYSSMLEADGGNPGQAMYTFSKPSDPLHPDIGCILDCEQIQQALDDLQDSNSVLGREVSAQAKLLKSALGNDKKINLLIAKSNQDKFVDCNNCADPQMLHTYWETFFKTLGISEISWASVGDFYSRN